MTGVSWRWDANSRFRQRRLIVLTVTCALVLATAGLNTGPTDTEIRDGNVTEASR